MPTGSGVVRLWEKTGSDRCTVKPTRLTHVGHKDRAKGSVNGQFQVNSYPCSKQLGAWSYAGVCTPCADERRPWSSASTASPTSTRCIPASTMKRYSSARSMCSRWTATIIWMRFRASAPYRTDRVGRTRSAANGEGALLPKLLIFFRYGQADAEKRSRACLAPNLGFIRMATGVRLGNHARAAWR